MLKRKFRSLKELFAVTEEITPAFKGSCCIQGPAEESNYVIGMNKGSSGIEKRFGWHCSSGIFTTGAESTCNVCATPCSSCMHFNQVPALMGPKSDESSDEVCQGKKPSQCSFGDADLFSPFKSSSCNERQHTSSETSNLVNPCSSHDSFSENAESKATLNASEDVEMLAKCEKQKLKESKCEVESLQATAVFSNKSDPSEISSLRDICASTSSPKGEHSECSTEQVESSLGRVENASSAGLRHDAHDCAESVKLKMERGDGDRAEEAVNCLNQNDCFEKSNVSLVLPKLQESPLQSRVVENIDGADMVEDDVKVCDICGDAGREDLLAICTKCIDGAEHTYCMQIKLDKVPAGDWMCEECMLVDKYEEQKRDDFKKVVGTSNGSSLLEISQNSRSSSTSKSQNSLKLDFKESRTNKASSNPQFTHGDLVELGEASAKRLAGNLVTAPVTKRRALETSAGSPKASRPCKKVLLSRGSSFKNLYEGRLQPDHQKFSPRDHCSTNILENTHMLTVSGHNSPKSQLQLQMSQGSLFKSNSFNIADSRMKVQQPEQDVLQKQKFSREIVTGDRKKEGTVKVMSKSISFSGTTSDCSNTTDSKVKMISSNFSHVEDLKRLQNANDQKSITRKNSFRSDNPMVSSPVDVSVSASKIVKKVKSFGDSILPLASQRNCCDLKAVQCHRNSNISSKPTSHLAQDGSKCPNDPAGSDGVMRLSLCSSNVDRDISFTRMSDSSPELKPNQENLNTNMKDVAEAATPRRHELHKKNRIPNQLNELPISSSNLDCQVASKEWLLTDSGCVSANGTNEGQDRLVNAVRQQVEHSTAIKAQDSNVAVPSKESPYMRGLPMFAPAVAVSSRITAVPELDYIWRGGIEMQSSGRLPRFCDGIQAHLSTCASPKVLEAVKKLPHKILLEEVSRLRTWPTQFLETCATEDNIALYFFAEDLESYGRNYKSLIKCMIENDLALRGSVDGIELLIFSSNLLPETSQRWNKLSFLWGVFRGRRVNYSEHKPNSQKTICIPNLNVVPSDQDLPVPGMSGSHNMFSPGQLDEGSSAPNISSNAQRASNSVIQLELPPVSSGRMNQICESRVASPEQKYLGLQMNVDLQPSEVDTIPLSSIPKKNEWSSKDMQDNNPSPQKEHRDPERRQEVDYKPCLQASRECDMDCAMVDKESECKGMKSCFGGMYESSWALNNSVLRFSSGSSGFCPSFPIDDESCYGSHDTEIPGNLRSAGRPLYSAHPSPVGESFGVDFKKVFSSNGKYRLESGVPSLELSLGAENKLATQGIMPLFLKSLNKKNSQGEQPKPMMSSRNNDGSDGELPVSLSLSLALPFSDEEQVSKAISKPMQLFPERHGVKNTSFLFGGFPNT